MAALTQDAPSNQNPMKLDSFLVTFGFKSVHVLCKLIRANAVLGPSGLIFRHELFVPVVVRRNFAYSPTRVSDVFPAGRCTASPSIFGVHSHRRHRLKVPLSYRTGSMNTILRA